MLYCVNCGRGWDDVTLFRIPSYAPELGACGECINKYGAWTLAHEADKWLAKHFHDEALVLANETEDFLHHMGCFHCGNPVVANSDGSRPLWCMKCHKELEAIRRK